MKKSIYLFLVFSLCSSFALANIGAVSTATGGTGRGAVETVDGLLMNPAFIADFPTKNFSFNYSPHEWALSVSDNGSESYFPAALQMVRTKSDVLETQKLGLSFTAPRIRKLVVGATLAMVEYSNYLEIKSELKYRQAVADLGLTLALTPDIGFGLVANKVGANKVNLVENLQLQKTIAMGLSYTHQNFIRFRFDVESAPDNKTDKLVYMAGLENYMNDWIVLRLGFKNNKVIAKDYVTAGLGFAGPQFGLHYAYIADTVDQTDQKHLIDLGIPF